MVVVATIDLGLQQGVVINDARMLVEDFIGVLHVNGVEEIDFRKNGYIVRWELGVRPIIIVTT